MKIISIDETVKPKVGDIIKFRNDSDNKNRGGYYLICQDKAETGISSSFFLICLSGEKGREIKFYNSINSLLKYHEGKYILYSSDLYDISLIKRGDV